MKLRTAHPYRRRPAKRALTLAAFLTLTLPPAISHMTAAYAASPAADTGPAGPLHPPAAAAHASGAPSTGARAFGAVKLADRDRGAPLAGAAYSAGATTINTTGGAATAGVALPASVDLSSNAPPIGGQGSVNSCIAWVTNYYLRGYYARRDGYYPAGGNPATGSFAPMYTYAQLVNGQNVGTSFNGNLDLMQSQGTDGRGDYTQGDVDYTDKPTSAETSNAAQYKISSWSNLPTGSGLQQAIETALTSGNPVGLGIAVYHNFYNATSTSYYVDVPPAGDTYIGNHGVTAFKYDANGVWVANQWGTGFGLNGWVELSWAFINNNSYIWQAVTVTPAATTPAQSVATNTPVPPTATATSTATPVPPTATATSTPVPPTATATNTATPAPPTATAPSIPPAATNTPMPPKATSTPPSVPTATNTPVPPAATPITLFSTSFESGQPQPTWTNTVDYNGWGGGLYNIGGICCGLTGPETGPRQEQAHTGTTALMYSGNDTGATGSFAYDKLFDASARAIAIGPTTTLSYWIYPQSSATAPVPVYGSNSTCVAIDMIFGDGSDLRDSGVTDQNGVRVHPAAQCGHLTLNTWNHVVAVLGTKLAGKTINRINVGYDQPANTGGYRGYIDDISIYN